MGNVGRPKGEQNKKITYSVRLDERMVERLNAYCTKMDKLKSEVFREALDTLFRMENERKDDYE